MSDLLLATDTSGKNGSIALARITSGQSDVEIIEAVQLAGGSFSAQLGPQIAAPLENHGYRKSDLGAFAVVSGPGSFTGLRVGLAAIKALAEALQKRVAAISLLEAVARSSKAHAAAHSRVLAALDASRGDVYVGNYEIVPETHMHSECLLSREELLAEAMRQTVVTPDAVLAEAVRAAGMAAGAQVELIEDPSAGVIRRLGWDSPQRGQAVGPEELEANYIRPSDAEIFSKPAT